MADLVLHTRVVSGSGGGPDKTILNSPRFLADSGYPMLCAYLRHPDDPGFRRLQEMAHKWNAPLVVIDDRGPFDRGPRARLAELCRERRPALWHAHDYKSNYLGLRLRRRHPMALVTTVHGWGVQGGLKTALYYALDRFLVKRYDQVICVSRDLRETCLGFGTPAERCRFLPNAIDTDEYRRLGAPADAERRTGVPAGRKVIGAVGRLSPEKGFGSLVRAVGALVGEGLDVELWLIGDGPGRERLDQLVQELGLGDRVRLLGYRDDTLAFYRAMDIYALSSRKEGLPNVVLEAMALELPVVSTRIAGIPELIEDGVNGLLIDPDDPRQMISALRRVVSEEGLATRLGTAARRTIESSYSMRARMERMREIYEEALGRRVEPL